MSRKLETLKPGYGRYPEITGNNRQIKINGPTYKRLNIAERIIPKSNKAPKKQPIVKAKTDNVSKKPIVIKKSTKKLKKTVDNDYDLELPKSNKQKIQKSMQNIETKKYRNQLKRGELDGAYNLVRNKIKFTLDDTTNLKNIIFKNAPKKIIEIETTDGRHLVRTINNKTWPGIAEFLRQGYWDEEENPFGSDVQSQIITFGIKSFRIVDLKKPKKMFKKSGKLFQYINKTEIDLTRYQIIKNTDSLEHIHEHCLIHTLRLHGISEAVLNRIKLSVEIGSHFPKTKLHDVSKIIRKKINLYYARTDKIDKQIYGAEYNESIDICLFENHYFIYDNTELTTYASKNYNDIHHLKNYQNIIKCKNNKYERSSNSKFKCKSINLIQELLKSGNFETNSHIFNVLDIGQNIKCDNIKIPLENIDNEQEIIEKKEIDSDYDIFFADTESIVCDKLGANLDRHKGFKSAFKRLDDDEFYTFSSTKENPNGWIVDYLNKVVEISDKKKQIIIYYHNLKYDFNLLRDYVTIINRCIKDGQLYSVDIIHNNRKIILKDTFKLISIPLSKFAKTFCLPSEMNKKEAINYTFYNDDNYDEQICKISDYLKGIRKDDIKTFYSNIKMKDENDIYLFDYDEKNKTFNPNKYYDYYLKYDVLVLEAGIKKYDELMKREFDMSVFDSLTISSYANKYMAKNGAFDNVYSVCGNLREYLTQAVMGGRVSVLESQRKKIITEHLVDYDACSLYPSAISRMCHDVGGVPTGQCRRIDVFSKQQLDAYKYYVVTIDIKKINKKQQIPFISHKRVDGIIDYINMVPKGGLKTVIDKITLEDYIKFHDIEYEIIDGVYWNDGYNPRMGQLIEEIYQKRLNQKTDMKKYKKQMMNETDEKKIKELKQKIDTCNILQNNYKLILNSAYGKTIIKKSKIERLIINCAYGSDEFNQYVYNHFELINDIIPFNDRQTEIVRMKYDDSYNMAIIGIMTLSMSKRIMNEVMGLANDNDIMIYYQDTDSMHMKKNDVSKLEELYLKTYNKQLNGSDMGNFHSDFDAKDENGDESTTEVYSEKSIFLGKKCYMDKLVGTRQDGSKFTAYHIRMKGITEAGLEEMKNREQYGSYDKVYEALAMDESLDFILNPDNSNKVMFVYTQQGVKTRAEATFNRTVCFKNNDE